MKDDPGAYAGFTEQGSSASQVTAAKVMDVTARLPDCDGQAADAVSAYTHRKMEDAPTLQKNPVRMSRRMDTSSTTQMSKSLANMEDPVVLLERNLHGFRLPGFLRKRQVEEVMLEL